MSTTGMSGAYCVVIIRAGVDCANLRIPQSKNSGVLSSVNRYFFSLSVCVCLFTSKYYNIRAVLPLIFCNKTAQLFEINLTQFDLYILKILLS